MEFKETKINYDGTEFGRQLLRVIVNCDIVNSKDYGKYSAKSVAITSLYVMENDLTHSDCKRKFTRNLNDVRKLDERDVLTYFNDVCANLTDCLSEKVLGGLQPTITRWCIQQFLDKTPIGGKEERRFDPSDIIRFAATDKAVLYVLMQNIYFSRTGMLLMRLGKDDDCLLANDIMKIYFEDKLKEKMDKLLLEERAREHAKKVEDEIATLKKTSLSKRGFPCIGKCEMGMLGKCSCTVPAYKDEWGVTYKWDYCDDC